MTIISDNHGNIINAELVLKDDCDVRGHRLLARALLEQRNEMYAMLESFLCLEGVIKTDKIKTLLAKTRGETL